MIDKDQLDTAANIAALEHMVVGLFASVTREYSEADFDRLVRSWGDSLDKETFPGVPAEQSALLSGEIRDHVIRLLQAVREARNRLPR